MHLLLLEDDVDLGQAVADHRVAAGHPVHWCRHLAEARTATPPELALPDLHLPDGDGLELWRAWRAAGHGWPVIVLTARDQTRDRILGLQAGADDHLVKPFDLDELLARVDAVSRRSRPAASPLPAAAPVAGAAGPPWQLNLAARSAWRGGELLNLTQMEWAVLACLAQWRGRIYSRNEIEHRLDTLGLADAASNALEVIVSRLRKKLGAAAISTHRGLGYRLEARRPRPTGGRAQNPGLGGCRPGRCPGRHPTLAPANAAAAPVAVAAGGRLVAGLGRHGPGAVA